MSHLIMFVKYRPHGTMQKNGGPLGTTVTGEESLRLCDDICFGTSTLVNHNAVGNVLVGREARFKLIGYPKRHCELCKQRSIELSDELNSLAVARVCSTT